VVFGAAGRASASGARASHGPLRDRVPDVDRAIGRVVLRGRRPSL